MDLQADLTRIGFTEYEAKVYLALLRESPATGYQISKKSGVPRSMVYEALGRLHARGAVLESIEERATLYRPVDPALLLDLHDEDHRRLVRSLRDGLGGLYNMPEEYSVWSLSGHRPVLGYASQMIRSVQAELFLLLGDADLDALHEAIQAACKRGVAISALLTGKGDLGCGEVAYHPPLESVLQEITDTLMVVADNGEVLIANTGDEATATVTRNRNVVMIARQFVWMELFAQRIHTQLGDEMIRKLAPEDRKIFESFDEV